MSSTELPDKLVVWSLGMSRCWKFMLRKFVMLTSEWVQFLGGVSPGAACFEKPQRLWLLFPVSVSPQGWLTARQFFPLTKEKLWRMRGETVLGSDLSAASRCCVQ